MAEAAGGEQFLAMLAVVSPGMDEDAWIVLTHDAHQPHRGFPLQGAHDQPCLSDTGGPEHLVIAGSAPESDV